MILDSSALVAVFDGEREHLAFSSAIMAAPRRRISAATLVEVTMVIDGRKDAVQSRQFDELVDGMDIEIAPFTERQARIAREAFRDFGRGSGHPAGLNLGDCFAYALAKDTGEPLLYKGDDFVYTDVRSVFPRGDVDGGSEAT